MNNFAGIKFKITIFFKTKSFGTLSLYHFQFNGIEMFHWSFNYNSVPEYSGFSFQIRSHPAVLASGTI